MVKNKNLLSLLAITVLLLSVALVNSGDFLASKVTNTQSVLSKSNEVRTEAKIEDEDNNVDNDENEVEDEVETEFEQETETASVGGTVNKFKLKIKTKMVNGKPFVKTVSGEREVKTSPEEVANNLVQDNLIDQPVSFEVKANNNKIEFEIQGVDSKKLFGLFDIALAKTVTVDSSTGDVLSTNQNFWTRFLSLLSI